MDELLRALIVQLLTPQLGPAIGCRVKIEHKHGDFAPYEGTLTTADDDRAIVSTDDGSHYVSRRAVESGEVIMTHNCS